MNWFLDGIKVMWLYLELCKYILVLLNGMFLLTSGRLMLTDHSLCNMLTYQFEDYILCNIGTLELSPRSLQLRMGPFKNNKIQKDPES